MAADSDDSALSLQEIELRKCLSNLFDFPERQLQAAFALVIELFHEQTSRQQILHKTFNALRDKQSEKDVTLSSCCVQLDKLSNDYMYCMKANDEMLRKINILADQLKELAGLCFGSTLFDNAKDCSEVLRTWHDKTSEVSYSERHRLSVISTGSSNAIEGRSTEACRRRDEIMLNEPNTIDPVSATAVIRESMLHIESTRSTENEKSHKYDEGSSEKASSAFEIDVGKSSKESDGVEEVVCPVDSPVICFPLKPSISKEAADTILTDEHCNDVANNESELPVESLSQNSDLVNHTELAAHGVKSQQQSLFATQERKPREGEENLCHVHHTLRQVQCTENLSYLHQEDACLSPLNNKKRNDSQENVNQYTLADEDFDDLSEIPKESKDVFRSAFPPKDNQVGLNVKGELQSTGKETQECLPSFYMAARRTSLSFGSTRLSMDNALGYRVRRLEDLFSSFEDEFQRKRAMSETGRVIQTNYDAEKACTKEEMNQLSIRLVRIEETLNKFLNASSISSTSDSERQVLDERRFDFSDQWTYQKDTKDDGAENKQLYKKVVEVTDSMQVPSAIAVDVCQSYSTGIFTSREQQTMDLIEWPNIQKMLAIQEDYFKSEMNGLLVHLNDLNDKVEEQLRRPLIQDTVKSSEVIGPENLVCVASPDDVSCRIDNIAAALAVVESKANSKVDLTELCNLIGSVTGEGSIEDGDASFGAAAKSLSLFKKNFEGMIKLLEERKADKSDLELSLRKVEGRLHETMEDIIRKSCTSENAQLKVQREVDECRSILDLFDSKIQFLASATHLDKSNSTVFSQIDAKIKESMHAVHASLEEAVSKKLEDISVLENELERVTSQLAEKPDEKQLRDMFNELELSLSEKIGTGATVQILLDNIRMEVMNKITKSEVQQLIKEMVGNAKKDVKAHEDDSLMIGTAPFRCLGCDQFFSRGVHNKLATKKNHQALPSSGYLKRYNLLYLDPSSMTSSNNTCESDINLPPMHNGLGFRRPKTSVFTSQPRRR